MTVLLISGSPGRHGSSPRQERPRDPADQGVAAFSSANTNTHRTIASDRGLLRPDVSAGSGGRGKNLPRVLLFGAVLVSPRERRFAVPRTRPVSGVRVCLACFGGGRCSRSG